MGKRIKRIFALMLAIAMCFTFATISSAYVDGYPNTHRNTGHHIADLIAVAKTQLGYTELNTRTGLPLEYGQDGGYTKYGAWFGDSTGAWCAYFVSWCASQAGIPTSIVPRLGNCAAAVNWYKNHSVFYSRGTGYVPKTGDIIFYNWGGGSIAQHIGIITGVSGNNIYTIEGNTDSNVGYRCAAKTRSRTANYIVGYGVPAYNDADTYVGSYSFASLYSSKKNQSGSIAYSTSKLSVITTSATEITSVNAVLNGSVENAGRLFINAYGFFFGKDKMKMTKYSVGGGTSKDKIEFTLDVATQAKQKLTPNTTYYYQTFATIDGRDYIGPTYAVVTVNDKPQQLILSETSVNVGVGQTAELMAAQLPVGSTDKGVTWMSSDETVATVSDGVITGVGYGQVTVSAKTNYGDVSAHCLVNVLIPKPENVKIFNSAEDEISISWDKVDGAKGYVIYRTESMDVQFKQYKKLGTDKDSFTDDKVEPGKRYYYCIITLAEDSQYNSDPTDTFYITAKLTAPENVQANSFFASSVRLNWNKVDDAKSYLVYRSDSVDGLYTIIGTAYKTEFVDNNALSGKEYFYKVVAQNNNIRTISDYSYKVSATACPVDLGRVDFEIPVPENIDCTPKKNESVLSTFGSVRLMGEFI